MRKLSGGFVSALVLYVVPALSAFAEARLPLVPISFLPDGSMLCAARMQKGKEALLILSEDYQVWKPLYETNGEIIEPALSYDRKIVVFSERLNAKTNRLCLLSLAEAKLTPLCTEPTPITSQQLSPMADRVVYATQHSKIWSQIVEIDIGTGKSSAISRDEGMYVSPFYSPSNGNVFCARLSGVKSNSPIASSTWHRLELLEFGRGAARKRGSVDYDTPVGPPKVFAGSTTYVIGNKGGLCNVFLLGADDKIGQITRNTFSMYLYDAQPSQISKQVFFAKEDYRDKKTQRLISVVTATNAETTLVDINKSMPEIRHLELARFAPNDDCSWVVISIRASGKSLPAGVYLRAIAPSTGEVLALPLPMGLAKR